MPLISVDFGSSGICATLGYGYGNIISLHKEPIAFYKPKDSPATAYELDATNTWIAACLAVKQCIEKSNINSEEIKGIGVTSQRFGIVLLNSDYKPLRICPNRDARSAFSVGGLTESNKAMLDELYEYRPALLSAWAKIAWFKEEKVELFKQIYTVCSIADWACLMLTGNLKCERSLGADSSLVKVENGRHSQELLQAMGIENIAIPPLCDSGTIVGEVTKRASEETGLNIGTPVIVCGSDTQTALLGLGATESEDIGIVAGWSTSIQKVTDKLPSCQPYSSNIWIGRHVIPQRWVLEANLGETGGTYQWLLNILFQSDSEKVMAQIQNQMPKTYAADNGIFSHLITTHKDMSRHPTMSLGGILMPLPLSFEPPDRGTLAKAVLEGFAFAIKDTIESSKDTFASADHIALAGGTTRNSVFNQLVANVLAKPIKVAKHGLGSQLGALSITASVVGDQTIQTLSQIRFSELDTIEPKDDDALHSQILYNEWKDQSLTFSM